MSPRLRSTPARPVLPPWGVWVYESHHAEEFRTDWMKYPFMVVIHYLQGKGQITFPDGQIDCQAGDTVFVPIGQKYQIIDEQDSPVSLYVLCVDPKVLPEKLAIESGVIASVALRDQSIDRMFRALLFEQSQGKAGCASMMVGLSLQMLTSLARSDRSLSLSAEERVLAYSRQMQISFFESTTLDEAAEAANLSRRRFSSLFRQINGCSWLDKLRHLRIAHASNLLLQTDRSVVAIAFESGFEDLSSFYRAFKREMSMSPSKYRESHR